MANFVGTVVTTTDASGRKGRSITNALGQLIRVDEPTATGGTADADLGTIASPNQPTYYTYSPQGKMVRVQQGVQNRYFKYDSLGRLLRVRQPEQDVNANLNLTDSYNTSGQWTAGFTYDVLGNVITATDAKGTVITNAYDRASRVITRSYSNEPAGVTTPAVSFYYDGKGLSAPQSPNFAKGKLTKVTSSVSESRYTSFDNMGRLLQSQQITDGQTYTSSYQYNFSGALVQETYPSGRVVKNEFESDGDLLNVTSKKASSQIFTPYVSNFSYTASGGISQLRLGNGRWETAKFNNRLQVTELGLGASAADASLWKVGYEYGELNTDGTVNVAKNTGNIARQTLSFTGLANPMVQAYKYDSLYRLTEAKETANSQQNWIQNWGYDCYGNRTSFSQNIAGNTTATNPAVDPNTNRFTNLTDFGYDKNGNITRDLAPSNQSRTFVFNGDNKQTEVKDANGVSVGKYFYDGEGKRVKKVTDTETTVFVYSSGKLIAEYSTAVPTPNPTTNYTATDQLGSPRVITNALGEVVSRRDFMPFGEELSPDPTYRTGNLKFGLGDNIRQKFTGYQKDEETQLDFAEARMYQNLHGRFTAIDPLLASGKSANPQTFNRYVYVINNPLAHTDPSGLQVGNYVGRIYYNSENGAFGSKGFADANPSLNLKPYNGKPITITASGYQYRLERYRATQIGRDMTSQILTGPDPVSNPQDYILNEVEKGVNATVEQTSQAIYDYSPDYCKVQCSLPVLGGLELSGSKDLRLFFGGGKTIGSKKDFGDFLTSASEFGKDGNFKFKIGCSATCGYFFNRDLSADERSSAISGTSVSGTVPLGFIPVVITGNQSLPFSTGERSIEVGYGESGGVSISQSEEIFDFKKWRADRLRNTSFGAYRSQQ